MSLDKSPSEVSCNKATDDEVVLFEGPTMSDKFDGDVVMCPKAPDSKMCHIGVVKSCPASDHEYSSVARYNTPEIVGDDPIKEELNAFLSDICATPINLSNRDLKYPPIITCDEDSDPMVYEKPTLVPRDENGITSKHHRYSPEDCLHFESDNYFKVMEFGEDITLIFVNKSTSPGTIKRVRLPRDFAESFAVVATEICEKCREIASSNLFDTSGRVDVIAKQNTKIIIHDRLTVTVDGTDVNEPLVCVTLSNELDPDSSSTTVKLLPGDLIGIARYRISPNRPSMCV